MTQPNLPTLDGDAPLDAAQLKALNRADTGFAELIGLEITSCSRREVRGFIDVRAHHLQPAGIVNGGVYAAIGETLGSLAAILVAGQPAVGMSNNTDLIGSVRSGRIEATATPVHAGRSTHLWRTEMRHEGELVAVSNLKLMVLRRS